MLSDFFSDFFNELLLHLRSAYPIIFIISADEQTASKQLREACLKLKLTLVEPRKTGTIPPFSELMLKNSNGGDVFLFNDIHRRLEDPDILRLLGDFDTDENSKKRAVIIAPFVSIPPELSRISALLELPLPDTAQLKNIINNVCVKTGVLLVDDDIDSLITVGQGLTAGEAKRAYFKALLGWPENVKLAKLSVEKDKRRTLARSSVLEFVNNTVNFDNVGGMDHLKKWLNARKRAFSKDAREFGLPVPKGLMLMGIQGCGKSLAAKAVGSFWQMPVIRLDIFAVFGHDHAEQILATALKTAEAMAPCTLWIDEIEKGFDSQAQGESSRLLGTLITWLQEKQKEVFVVATANKVESLPPELARKGRFDEIFFVDLPDTKERKEILTLHLNRRKLDPDKYDIKDLVIRTDKMTGSELEQLVISAMYIAFERGERPNNSDLLRALKNTVSLYETFEKDIKKLREWARTHARIASTDRSKLDYFK